MPTRSPWSLFAAALIAAAVSACGDPCEDLARRICRCQESALLRAQCNTAVRSAAGNHDSTGTEEQRCQEILDARTCTCEAARALDVKACGFARPDGPFATPPAAAADGVSASPTAPAAGG
jgi:hypothetical protein